jgi:ribosomal protein S18 acetylase RimI-like enzyme
MAENSKLLIFSSASAPIVLSWITTVDEARAWANLDVVPVDVSIFSQWHADPDIRPFLMYQNDRAVGYGEVWTDFEAGEVELGRILVKPTERGRGIGRQLVAFLLADAARSGYAKAFVRVIPDNASAIACYTRCGFLRANPDDERLYNCDQPVEYVWLERVLSP